MYLKNKVKSLNKYKSSKLYEHSCACYYNVFVQSKTWKSKCLFAWREYDACNVCSQTYQRSLKTTVVYSSNLRIAFRPGLWTEWTVPGVGWGVSVIISPFPGCHCLWDTAWAFLPCCTSFSLPLPSPPGCSFPPSLLLPRPRLLFSSPPSSQVVCLFSLGCCLSTTTCLILLNINGAGAPGTAWDGRLV